MNNKKLILNAFVACSVGTLAACSSSSDSTSTASPTSETPTTSSTIVGSIFAAPVNGADVSVKDMGGNTVAGPVMTNADGSYSIDVPDSALAFDLVFESTGGVFDDEATDAAGIGTDAGSLSALVAGGSLDATSSVHVTPGTTIHADLVTDYGKTATDAKTAFFTAFAYNPDFTIQPVDVTEPAALTANDLSRLSGFRALVFSQLAQNLGLTAAQQFDMFAALAQDLSDGTLDGVDANGPVAIGASGISLPADILSQYIATAASFTEATTASYTVQYEPSGMTTHGKDTFSLTITDGSGLPVTGLVDNGSLSLMPMMYMNDMMHSTPMGGITESASGVYDVIIYYLMPSRMMDGTTMGTWDLKVNIGSESAHFYPNVQMAMMTNTVRVQLKGINDTIIDMNGLEVPRTYNLFRDRLATLDGDNNDEFDVFIAPIETMTSFPALIDGMTLMSGMGGDPYLVDGITVEASVNDGTFVAGIDNGNGTWSFTGLTLNSGTGMEPVANTICVRLTVSGETKTTVDAEGNTVDCGTFTVTLPSM
ncbi:MAG: hypothetical protein HKP12_10410 [Gammaproteobacteria bacterium]|nr:hypothetical protein [Gammaproteobacteria bacterium]